jgi:hypothetical protein
MTALPRGPSKKDDPKNDDPCKGALRRIKGANPMVLSRDRRERSRSSFL